VIDPNDWRTAYVSDLSGTILRITGGGATVEALSSPLDGTGAIYSLSLVRANDGTHVLFAGTEKGIWRTISPAASSVWTEFGRGMPLLPVIDLQYDATDDILLAATYGRGVWSVSGVKSISATLAAINISGTAAADTVRLVRHATNPDFIDIFFNNNAGRDGAD